jgi:hypothetical protein
VNRTLSSRDRCGRGRTPDGKPRRRRSLLGAIGLVHRIAHPRKRATPPGRSPAADKNPRTECGCQPVAFINSFEVTPPVRFSRSRILAVLLPSRASSLATLTFVWLLGAFLAGLAFFPALAFAGATLAARAPALALRLAFGLACCASDFAVSPSP